MTDACACHPARPAVLDIRDMAPKGRHPKIIETFDALEPCASFILVSDHDPKPLFYQFTFERPGGFRWRYLEDGPDVWRVEIGKALPVITADQKVGDVAQQYPGALDVMKQMGINHCCGAHLTLTEAAAAAGIPLPALIEALDGTRRGAA